MDGKKWADAFMELWGDKLEQVDHGLMLSWFCNAIMAGYDEAARRASTPSQQQPASALEQGSIVSPASIAELDAILNGAPADNCEVLADGSIIRKQPASALVEAYAKEIYAAMQWAVRHAENGRHTPDWFEGGNSHAQTEARKYAKEILDRQHSRAPDVEAGARQDSEGLTS